MYNVVLKKKWANVIRSGWTPDVCKVTNVRKTYKMDRFIQRSVWTPSVADPGGQIRLWPHGSKLAMEFGPLGGRNSRA